MLAIYEKQPQVHFKVLAVRLSYVVSVIYFKLEKKESLRAVLRHILVPSFAPQTQKTPHELINLPPPHPSRSILSCVFCASAPHTVFLPHIQLSNLSVLVSFSFSCSHDITPCSFI